MDEDANTHNEEPTESKINHRNGMLMEDWIEGGKNTRFNGSNAAEMAKRSAAVREAKRERDRDLQLIIQEVLSKPLKGGDAISTDSMESFDQLKSEKNLTVVANGVVRIAENLGKKGGSIPSLEALAKMGGMMPTPKAEVSVEGINEIRFVVKSPKEDIDKFYPEIRRICETHGIDPGKPEGYVGLKEY